MFSDFKKYEMAKEGSLKKNLDIKKKSMQN